MIKAYYTVHIPHVIKSKYCDEAITDLNKMFRPYQVSQDCDHNTFCVEGIETLKHAELVKIQMEDYFLNNVGNFQLTDDDIKEIINY